MGRGMRNRHCNGFKDLMAEHQTSLSKHRLMHLFKRIASKPLILIRRWNSIWREGRVGDGFLTKYIFCNRHTFFLFLAFDIFVYVRTLFFLCFLFLFWTMWSIFVHDPLFNNSVDNICAVQQEHKKKKKKKKKKKSTLVDTTA